MKIRSIILSAAALLVAFSCSRKASDVTRFVALNGPEGPYEVHVMSGAVDTVLLFEDGKATVDLPVFLEGISGAESDAGSVLFISDGTRITLDMRGVLPLITSSDPKGVQSTFDTFQETLMDYEKKLAERPENQDEIYRGYKDYIKGQVKSQPGNAIGLIALAQSYYEYDDPDELVEDINNFSPALRENDIVQQILQSTISQSMTSEGKPFVDFEVEYDSKVQKFSDYIGRGKYVLVDFWASWCGPCKQEIPNLKDVYAKYHGRDFDILGVAVWDEPQASIDTAKVYALPWNQILNAQRTPTEIYGISGIPHIILFGPDGTILRRGLRGEEISSTIAEYLGK